MPMAHMEEIKPAAPQGALPLEAEHRRLQKLLGELLQTNQELRFKVEQLEKQAERAELGLKRACATAGMLL
jgi:hypothetical protein